MPGDRARSRLSDTSFADLRWVHETGSTNADLLQIARDEPAARRVVLVADHQSAGRGRLDRSWESPPGSSLLASFLLRDEVPVGDLHLLTTALGLAAAQACERVTGIAAGLKWPNDLVAVGAGAEGGDRKLGGILAETAVVGSEVAAVVLGIGVNVDWPEELPPDLDGIAIALNHLTGAPVDVEDLLVELVIALEGRLDLLSDASGRDLLMEEYRARSATLGSRVKVVRASDEIEGVATAVTSWGTLLVETPGGTVEVDVGDVVHLRAAD